MVHQEFPFNRKGDSRMGFSVYYRSTQPVEPAQVETIRSAAGQLNGGRTWLHSEPVSLFVNTSDGHLLGGSKPNFFPDAGEEAAAVASGMPDGSLQDVLEILEQLSRDYGVDWEISHDESDGPVGYVRDGVCDDDARSQIEIFASLAETLAEDFGEMDEDEFMA